jgi:hypothetical protein
MMARLALAILCMCSWTWAVTDIDNSEWRLTAPLVRAGIALDDEAALIGVLQRKDDPRLATGAAYVLGKLPRTDTSVRELTVAASSEDEILMNYAIRSLLQLGDTNWVDAARARFPTVKDGLQRLELAGELARGGAFDGWDLITSAITEGDLGHREVALSRP